MPADPEPLFRSDGGEYVAFRWTNYDVPFWARENSRDGRWNRAGEGATQYWSLTPEAAWAELIRGEDLRTEAQLETVRMPLWAARVPSPHLVDLRASEEREKVQITDEQLIDDDWRPCQDLATELRRNGCGGIITPSAALPDHASLTIFGRRRAIDWTSRLALASAVPAAQAAVGRPPPNGRLLSKVRRRQMPDEPSDRLF